MLCSTCFLGFILTIATIGQATNKNWLKRLSNVPSVENWTMKNFIPVTPFGPGYFGKWQIEQQKMMPPAISLQVRLPNPLGFSGRYFYSEKAVRSDVPNPGEGQSLHGAAYDLIDEGKRHNWLAAAVPYFWKTGLCISQI